MATKPVIESLTPEQEAQLDVYYQKWLKIGLSAKPTTPEMRTLAESLIKEIYQNEKLSPPQEILWCGSPLSAAKKCIELGDSKDNLLYSAGYGSHDANWLAFYDYMLNVLEIEECKDLVPLMKLAEVSGWWWPYENVCILSELPIECHTNTEGNLHNDSGPSIAYSDGFKMFHLNGIEVSEEIATIEKEKITKQMILGEQNADVRRELMRKVGEERMAEIFNATPVDEMEGYTLVKMDYDESKTARPYLKMKNPSINAVHVEGVRPEIDSVRGAICFRNKLRKYMAPEKLT